MKCHRESLTRTLETENIDKKGGRNNMELILGLALIGIVYVASKSTEWKFNNYTPPQGQRIDYNKQSYDRIVNNLTNEQVMKNTMNGKYNVKR